LRAAKGGKMAEYSYVKDEDGKVCGIWIKDVSAIDKPGMIEFVLTKESPELLNDYISKNYRKVANNYDSVGGCFIMFGSSRAPGEKSSTQSENTIIAKGSPSLQLTICKYCGYKNNVNSKSCESCGKNLFDSINKKEIRSNKEIKILNPKVLEIVNKYSSLINDKNIYLKPDIPSKILTNAISSYGESAIESDVLLVIDDSITGNANKGMIITDDQLFVKNTLENPNIISILRIKDIDFKNGFLSKILYINGVKYAEFTGYPKVDNLRLIIDFIKELVSLKKPE